MDPNDPNVGVSWTLNSSIQKFSIERNLTNIFSELT